MPRKLGPKLILSLTILIVAISGVSGYLNFRTQKRQLVDTMVLGADELSRSLTSATWQFMLDDDRRAAYQIMQTIADKEGVDRIRMFNREGRLVFSTDAHEQPRQGLVNLSNEVCASCHNKTPITDKPAQGSRVRYATTPEGFKTISMVTPIYNEPSCSNASCHAHKASTKVLGVVDVALRLDPVKAQTRTITLQTILWTLLEVSIGAAFVILFTRRFVGTPIRQLIKATKAVSEMDLDRHIEITERSQELDELVDSFNRMRKRLKLAVNELNEMQQTLETKVEERTQQLQSAQRKLVQSDRLASLGQLAASVAHEINNPVSGVLNLSMLLERLMASGAYPPGREAEFRKYLSLISTETARVGRLKAFDGVKVHVPDGTFYCFPDFSAYMKDSQMLANMLLNEVRVVTVPGKEFGFEGHLRLSYCGTIREITEGLDRIKWALDPNSANELYLGDRKLVREWV